MFDICLVAAVNSDNILRRNLLASPCIANDLFPVLLFSDFDSASKAYNEGLDKSSARYCIFVHQDVYLPEGWENVLQRAIENLDADDGNWAVLGVYGVSSDGVHVGRVWSSGLGRELIGAIDGSAPVQSVDELLIVLDRSKGVRFDDDLPGFHLYGTDIVQAAISKGFSAYVVDAPVIHNSKPVLTLFGSYIVAAKYLSKKWRDRLPLQTPVAYITTCLCHLYYRSLRIYLRKLFRRSKTVGEFDPKTLSFQLGYSNSSGVLPTFQE